MRYTTKRTIEDLFKGNIARFGPLAQYTSAIMDADSELSRSEREEIALFTSGLNGCAYCIGDHSAVLRDLGVEEGRIEGAAKGSLLRTSQQMKPLLEVVAKLTLQCGEVDPSADYRLAIEAGWSMQGIEDAICISSLFCLFNRLIKGVGLQGTPESHAQAGKSLSKGYS